MSRFSKTFSITIQTACGDERGFNNISKAEMWLKVHTKRCACCEQANLVRGHRKYTGDIKNKNDEERIQQEMDIQHSNTRELGLIV
jgi:hypothetical protein